MAVYFIRAGEDGPVKIGTADDVPTRLHELQCGNHLHLSVIREVDGGRRTEAWFHRHFASLRARGEWFEWSAEMLTASAPDIPDNSCTMHGGVIKSLGGKAALARALGFADLTAAGKWPQRGIPPRYWHRISEIAAEKGIPVTVDDLERWSPLRSASPSSPSACAEAV